MSRFIIDNRSLVNDVDVLSAIQQVISNGRVSKDNTCYCYLTTFRYPAVMISAELTRTGNDKFTIFDHVTREN